MGKLKQKMGKVKQKTIHVGNRRKYINQRAILMKDKKTIYSAFIDAPAIFETTKRVKINGETYYSSPETHTFPACSLTIYDDWWRGWPNPTLRTEMYYEECRAIFYKGEFYGLFDFEFRTMDELKRTWKCLNRIWDDLEWCVSDSNLKGYTRLLSGHSRWLSRKITEDEILMTHKELMHKANKSPYDCGEAVRFFIRDICEYLMISEGQYISGRYDVKVQMIKRLKLKANDKNKRL